MDALKIGLLFGIVAVAVAITVEIRAWLVGARLVSKLQKIYRVVAAAMIEIIFLMVLFLNDIVHSGHLFAAVCYLSATVALGFGLLFVALLDFRETLSVYRRRRTEAYRDLLGEETEPK
jgi:hypothetical protein